MTKSNTKDLRKNVKMDSSDHYFLRKISFETGETMTEVMHRIIIREIAEMGLNLDMSLRRK